MWSVVWIEQIYILFDDLLHIRSVLIGLKYGFTKDGITGDWLAHIFTPYKKIKAMFCWR